MGPAIPILLGLGLVAGWQYKKHGGIKRLALAKKPPAPPPGASGGLLSGGNAVAPPPSYPGLVGLYPATQTFTPGQVTNAIYAFSDPGPNITQAGVNGAILAGRVVSASASSVVVQLIAVQPSAAGQVPPFKVGDTVNGPPSVWAPGS